MSQVGKHEAGLEYWPEEKELSHRLFTNKLKELSSKLFQDKTCVLKDLPTR